MARSRSQCGQIHRAKCCFALRRSLPYQGRQVRKTWRLSKGRDSLNLRLQFEKHSGIGCPRTEERSPLTDRQACIRRGWKRCIAVIAIHVLGLIQHRFGPGASRNRRWREFEDRAAGKRAAVCCCTVERAMRAEYYPSDRRGSVVTIARRIERRLEMIEHGFGPGASRRGRWRE